jgi:hypothetical protein
LPKLHFKNLQIRLSVCEKLSEAVTNFERK